MSDVESHQSLTLVKKLTDHYKPRNPLEVLQIERIALYTAKLKKLYEIEHAKSELALLDIQLSDQQIWDHFDQIPDYVRHSAWELITVGRMTDPFKLSDRVLAAIDNEILGLVGELKSESDLVKFLPVLVKFLATVESGENLSAKVNSKDERAFSAHRRLRIVSRQILNRITSDLSGTEPVNEVDRLLRNINLDEATSDSASNGPVSEYEGRAFHNDVVNQFAAFRQLNAYRKQAREVAARYQTVKSLMMNSAMMPPEDSDRLMRYQISLERQLSRAMGEFLQLRGSVS